MISGESAVAKILIEHGADVNNRDLDNETPLHFAAGEGNAFVVSNCEAKITLI